MASSRQAEGHGNYSAQPRVVYAQHGVAVESQVLRQARCQRVILALSALCTVISLGAGVGLNDWFRDESDVFNQDSPPLQLGTQVTKFGLWRACDDFESSQRHVDSNSECFSVNHLCDGNLDENFPSHGSYVCGATKALRGLTIVSIILSFGAGVAAVAVRNNSRARTSTAGVFGFVSFLLIVVLSLAGQTRNLGFSGYDYGSSFSACLTALASALLCASSLVALTRLEQIESDFYFASSQQPAPYVSLPGPAPGYQQQGYQPQQQQQPQQPAKREYYYAAEPNQPPPNNY